VHVAVLPGTEPEQNNVQIVCAGSLYDLVDGGEVKVSGLRFKLFPVDRSLDSVGVQRLH
jgi:hypothetical protein